MQTLLFIEAITLYLDIKTQQVYLNGVSGDTANKCSSKPTPLISSDICGMSVEALNAK